MVGAPALAEEPSPGAAELAGQDQAAPLPPEGSAPLLRTIELNFDAQGGVPTVEAETYLYYMEIMNYRSLPSEGRWEPYTETTEQILLEDFRRLWDTGFLDDLSIEVVDQPYSNGVMGKHVIFRFEERERVRTFTFEGSDLLDRGDIDTAMRENNLSLRLDAFLDPSAVRQVEGLLRVMFSAEGYPFATVTHEVRDLASINNAVELTFLLDAGPKVHVEEIEFVGNEQLSDGELKGQMKEVKERWWLSWMTGRGTYKEALFEQDADRLVARYLEKGYIDARVGQPETDYLEASPDGTRRGMRLRIPVDEGERFRLGDVRFDGNTVVNDFGMSQVFAALEPGDYYSQRDVVEAIEAARELYGSLGYTELTVFPDLQKRTSLVNGDLVGAAVAGGEGNVEDIGGGLQVGDNPYADLQRPTHIDGAPVVDVTMRIEEGEQQFVNRITFVGNESTHDEVIRREMQLVENGVFNTAALKNSIRRVNQLGYFEPLEESHVAIENVEGEENEVDLTVNLIEANLNQLTFGMGISQFDGFFGQLSFATTNFLGRGETLSVGLQSGSRLRNINLGYTKPYMFNRSISTGVNLFSRRVEYIGAYTEDSNGGSVSLGWPLRVFTWAYLTYSFEDTAVSDVNTFFGSGSSFFAGNPFFADALESRTVSKISPSVRHNTVDHPIFPSSGKSYTATMEVAGLGGDTRFLKPVLEGTWYFPHLSRTTLGLRVQYQHIAARDSANIPVFERLWLGGEYSVRGFDIRRIGPTVGEVDQDVLPDSFQGRTVIGGNKSFLVNAEYQFSIAQPVRLIVFYDAGQVQDFGNNFAMDGFKTSTGLELRFFMPVLNVPFRLIYAWNPQRDGVFNDQFQPQEETVFRFAVGTTF
jgi:outer membrane protein insertion porin family